MYRGQFVGVFKIIVDTHSTDKSAGHLGRQEREHDLNSLLNESM